MNNEKAVWSSFNKNGMARAASYRCSVVVTGRNSAAGKPWPLRKKETDRNAEFTEKSLQRKVYREKSTEKDLSKDEGLFRQPIPAFSSGLLSPASLPLVFSCHFFYFQRHLLNTMDGVTYAGYYNN